MVKVYGTDFDVVPFPRCRFRGNVYFLHVWQERVSVTNATFISNNLIICRAPSRLPDGAVENFKLDFVDPVLPNTSPWYENVDVNAKLGSSYALQLNGLTNYANAPYHRNLIYFCIFNLLHSNSSPKMPGHSCL